MTERDNPQSKSELQLALDEYRQLDEASRTGIVELIDPRFYPHLPAHVITDRLRDVLLRNTNDAKQIWAQRRGMGFRPSLTSADLEEQERSYTRYETLAAKYNRLGTTDQDNNHLLDSTSNTSPDNSGNTVSPS
jgi:hypothetical protein